MIQEWTDGLVGTTLGGRYRVGELIGLGGMGAVFEGEHVQIGKRVALKVLAPKFAVSARERDRFMQEARAAATIRSRHVVDITDFGEHPTAFFAMEFLEGSDLAARLRSHGPLPWDYAADGFQQICHGVRAAHRVGVVHRDLKPSNIFLARQEDGTELVKLLDFGIAKVTDEGGGRGITRTGEAVGTVLYMAPEQALGRTVDPRTDIYTLGIVLYQIVTGTVPFRGDSQFEIIEKHVRAPAPMMRELVPDIPAQLDAIAQRCMAKHPDDRFASVEDLSLALEALQQPPSIAIKPAEKTPEPGRVRKTLHGLPRPAPASDSDRFRRSAVIFAEPILAPEPEAAPEPEPEPKPSSTLVAPRDPSQPPPSRTSRTEPPTSDTEPSRPPPSASARPDPSRPPASESTEPSRPPPSRSRTDPSQPPPPRKGGTAVPARPQRAYDIPSRPPPSKKKRTTALTPAEADPVTMVRTPSDPSVTIVAPTDRKPRRAWPWASLAVASVLVGAGVGGLTLMSEPPQEPRNVAASTLLVEPTQDAAAQPDESSMPSARLDTPAVVVDDAAPNVDDPLPVPEEQDPIVRMNDEPTTPDPSITGDDGISADKSATPGSAEDTAAKRPKSKGGNKKPRKPKVRKGGGKKPPQSEDKRAALVAKEDAGILSAAKKRLRETCGDGLEGFLFKITISMDGKAIVIRPRSRFPANEARDQAKSCAKKEIGKLQFSTRPKSAVKSLSF